MMGVEPDSDGWARDGLEPFSLLAPLAVSESPLAEETYESVMENQGTKKTTRRIKVGCPSSTSEGRARVR